MLCSPKLSSSSLSLPTVFATSPILLLWPVYFQILRCKLIAACCSSCCCLPSRYELGFPSMCRRSGEKGSFSLFFWNPFVVGLSTLPNFSLTFQVGPRTAEARTGCKPSTEQRVTAQRWGSIFSITKCSSVRKQGGAGVFCGLWEPLTQVQKENPESSLSHLCTKSGSNRKRIRQPQKSQTARRGLVPVPFIPLTRGQHIPSEKHVSVSLRTH